MRTIILWITMLGLVAIGGALEGLQFHSFIQPAAAVIVFGPIAAHLLFSLGPVGVGALLSRIFGGKLHPEDNPILDRVATMGFLMGGIAATIGFVSVMQNLADAPKLGAGVAVALIGGGLYGILPALLVTTFQSKGHSGEGIRTKSAAYVAACILGFLLSLFVVMFALSNSNREQKMSLRQPDAPSVDNVG